MTLSSTHIFVLHSLPDIGLYYKSKLELKSNWSKILPVNCKFICHSTSTEMTKLKLEVL